MSIPAPDQLKSLIERIERGAGQPSTHEKGGLPEDSRQKVNTMEAVADAVKEVKTPRIIPSTDSPDKRVGKWLDAQIGKGKSGVFTTLVDLDPTLARVLLNRNAGNRRVNDTAVESYARDMKNGVWRFNGEPIIISNDGLVNDGQHRCEAVVKADVVIQALMVFGVDRESRTTLDQGRNRSAGDYLSMHGHVNVLPLAAAASTIWQYLNKGKLDIPNKDRATKGELIHFIEEHPDIVTSVAFSSRKGVGPVGGWSFISAMHWILTHKAGRRLADDFTIALVEGASLGVGHPILYVRNRLINERGRLRANDKAELVFKAWNATRNGQTMRAVQLNGGKLPSLKG